MLKLKGNTGVDYYRFTRRVQHRSNQNLWSKKKNQAAHEVISVFEEGTVEVLSRLCWHALSNESHRQETLIRARDTKRLTYIGGIFLRQAVCKQTSSSLFSSNLLPVENSKKQKKRNKVPAAVRELLEISDKLHLLADWILSQFTAINPIRVPASLQMCCCSQQIPKHFICVIYCLMSKYFYANSLIQNIYL